VTHFVLVTVDAESLGPVELARPDWPPGSIIYRGGEPNLRVVSVIPSDDPEKFDCSSASRPNSRECGHFVAMPPTASPILRTEKPPERGLRESG